MSKGRQTTTSTRTFMTPPEVPKKPRKKLKIKTPKLPRIGIPSSKLPWILVILLVGASAFMFMQYKTAQDKINNPTPAQNKQVSDVIKNVSKIAIVPIDDTPTVATVLHADKVNSQAFFVNAKDGDKVLVYGKEKRAILYRPSTNQIVNISTVTSAPTNPSSTIGN